MYNNPYYYNSQLNVDRIDKQIADLEKMKTQLQQPVQPITQNFQISPNREMMRYANTIDDVNKETVYFDTPFFSKDMSVVWVKNAKGDIKPYELNEIVQKDEKDLQIELLMAQVNELKGMIKNAKPNDDDVNESIESEKTSNVSTTRTSTKKQKKS